MKNLTDKENDFIGLIAREFISDFDNYFEAVSYFTKMYNVITKG